jgi:hypothetical protein
MKLGAWFYYMKKSPPIGGTAWKHAKLNKLPCMRARLAQSHLRTAKIIMFPLLYVASSWTKMFVTLMPSNPNTVVITTQGKIAPFKFWRMDEKNRLRYRACAARKKKNRCLYLLLHHRSVSSPPTSFVGVKRSGKPDLWEVSIKVVLFYKIRLRF